MKHRIALALAALAPLALTVPAVAQELEQDRAREDPMQKAYEMPLEVEYYRPKKADAGKLARLAQQLFGNGFRGAEFVGPLASPATILEFGQSVLIRGYEPQVREVLNQLTRLDAEWQDGPAGGRLETLQYRVRHVSMDSIAAALDPFERPIVEGDVQAMQQARAMSINVGVLRERGLVIVRDTPERLKTIRGVLEAIDVPATQLLVTAYVIHGNTDAAKEDPRLPAELTRDLKQLVPYSGFELLSIGFLRSDGVGPMLLEVELQGGADFRLQLRPQAYDPEGGALNLSDCEFQISENTGQARKRRFSTSALLRQGEYTVLGGLGDTPVLVVLRLAPQKG